MSKLYTADRFVTIGGTTAQYVTGTGSLVTFPPIPSGADYIQNQIASAQSANMWISGSAYVNGSVGIGTSTPYGILTIKQGASQLDVSTGSDSIILEALDRTTLSNPVDIRSYARNGNHTWSTGAYSERMRITNAGNVGIGTSSPSYKLDVSGTGRFVNQLRVYSLLSDNQIKGSSYVELSPDQTTYNAWNIRVGAQAADNCYYITGGGVNILTTEGYSNPYTVKLYSNGAQTLTMTNSAIKFNAYGSGSFTGTATQKLAVDSSGNIIEIPIGAGPVDGSGTTNFVTKWTDSDTIGNSLIYDNGTSVGIGTITPNGKFEIANAGDTSLFVTATSAGSATLNLYPTGGGISQVGAVGAVPLAFRTNNSERMRITSGGNVGIGTTSPGARLTVQTTTSSSADALQITDGTGTINIGHWDTFSNRFELSGKPTYFVQYGTGNSISFGTLGSENMRIAAGGNVGIGTSSPSDKLDINGITSSRLGLNVGAN
jgi:hypothetical protein